MYIYKVYEYTPARARAQNTYDNETKSKSKSTKEPKIGNSAACRISKHTYMSDTVLRCYGVRPHLIQLYRRI